MGCVYSRSCIGEICAPRDIYVKETENVKAAAEITVFSPAHSDSEEGEIRDELNQLARDNEVGITRLSRVSAQFLPPDGSRTVKVPSGNLELCYSFLSQRGYYPDALDKANQDSFCIHTPFGSNLDDHFFGVFDGHGEVGAQCSNFVKQKLCENLLRNSQFHVDAVEACHAAFLATNSQLHDDVLDDSMSGTTAITVLVRGKTLYVANAGDSRALIAERRGNDIVAVDLSIDQTPFRPDELERVKLCGARVLTLDQIEGLKTPDVQCWGTEEDDDGDPPRIWVQNGMYPGTAFTRSIGDSIAETVGVVANPEIVVLELTSNNPFFVIASDGVFEFLSSQTVVEMVWIFTVISPNEERDHMFALKVATSFTQFPVDGPVSSQEIEISYVLIIYEAEDFCNLIFNQSLMGHAQSIQHHFPHHTICYLTNRLMAYIDKRLVALVCKPPETRLIFAVNVIIYIFLTLLSYRYNKPLQASVRAVTNGTLWALKREDFREILMSEFSNLSSLKLLQSVDILSRLTILQLSHVADSLSEVSFSDGQRIVNTSEDLLGLYIIQKGVVKITCDMDSVKCVNASSLMHKVEKQHDEIKGNRFSVEKTDGSYFGEWTLLGENIAPLGITAVGDVVCSILTKEKFDSVVGSLAKHSQENDKLFRAKDYSTSISTESNKNLESSTIGKVQPADLEWRTCLCSTDCSEIGLVLLRDSDNLLSLKRFSKQKIKNLGKEARVLKEKNLMKHIRQSTFVPRVICTSANQTHAGILLDTCIACSAISIIRNALDEPSARFCAASVVIALDDLHKMGILYRGVSPDVLMFDQTGYIQLVDFKFGKMLSGDFGERTYTLCGMANSLAPEIIQGKGHGFPADWWALGTFIYFMLQGEMPFGSWRESELTFARIVKGQLTLPQTFSLEAVDLITKLLEVDESTRLGSQGIDSIKCHPWFDGVDWEGLAHRMVPVPNEILLRINQRMESYSEDASASIYSPLKDVEELNTPEWLEDW
ncbi:protein phosphatase 2C and cyclic nucleotide-binding/kinase domain-containing protein-like [Olea europaea var. sylvestris]|uniref:protein phosphatase 2C and cyclic nucleotide-binding/kinase domain-containing protein-like n=1 Tax=Olea europaea var. sylvestris TaxID=158386 RepID=UPI000C1D8948|nr:protein phosphatase 2C and cyclic nucleotide-binding/kinase domain-containing protein-like [Olea europaea var. sylvestris]